MNEEPIARLIYTSRLASPGSPDESAALVREIAERAAPANRAIGVTGVLLHVDGSFIQVLEGLPEAVETVFERICCDFRHADVELIDLVSDRDRLFTDWSMAFITDGGSTPLALREELVAIRTLCATNSRDALRQMRALLERQPVAA